MSLTPEIEELSPLGNKQENSKGEGHCEANLKPITINEVPIGEAGLLYEVMHIQTESMLISVVIIYDTGSEVSLCNYETRPMVASTKEERTKIVISTINSVQTRLIQVCKIDLNNYHRSYNDPQHEVSVTTTNHT